MITRELWAKISKEPYDKWVPLLEDLLPDYGINTPRRIAMFLAQAAHESGGFSHLVENLNYSAAGLAKTWPKFVEMLTLYVNSCPDAEQYAAPIEFLIEKADEFMIS